MDRTNAIFLAEPEALSVPEREPAPEPEPKPEVDSLVAPTFDAFLALQARAGRRRLDEALVALVTDRAMAFAALTPREQAAIAWVEAVISSGKTQSADGAYAALRRHFDEAAIAKLTALAGTASARAKLGAPRRG